MSLKKELLIRYPKNPIITYDYLPFNCNAVYNPGAVKFKDKYLLLPRVENGRRDNKLHVAVSDDGMNFKVEPDPIKISKFDDGIEEYHLYDPRITFLEGNYYITYCSQNFDEIVRIGLLKTDDFKSFRKLGYITQPWSRNCALFPEKINGLYARIDRPMCGNDSINFISYSPDLIHWGQFEPIILTPQTWMRQKWGVGPTPIKTDAGWLVIIHGVWFACNFVYRLGAVLLDLKNPSKVIGQCPEFILTPREPYERNGETIDCVFSNGTILEPNGELKIYYGAADTSVCLAFANIYELIEACYE